MTEPQETFEDFRRSFSYGSRSNLDFKFLKSLSDAEAGEFFEDLLAMLGDSYDHGRLEDVIDHVVDWQTRAYTPAIDAKRTWTYDTGPFTHPSMPLAGSRVALLTSSGHFPTDNDPNPFGIESMTQAEAEDRISEFLKTKPELTTIPVAAAADEVSVRHGGYDVASAALDHNVTFPIDILRDLESEGFIGELHPDAFSFVGAAAQRRIIKESGPEWAQMLVDAEIDVVLLVPV
ncbi:MAG: hypothetical protein HKN93_05900 [Acidimicrobiia bacterium]|nr:hypothetical protein [Acidimicrobiia bacterium]